MNRALLEDGRKRKKSRKSWVEVGFKQPLACEEPAVRGRILKRGSDLHIREGPRKEGKNNIPHDATIM